jgi:membrane protease YdiL (CAAX protease family)
MANTDSFVRRHPLCAFFGVTFVWSWGSVLALLAPRLLAGQPIPTWYGLTTFPALILGPALASLGLTAILDGRPGLRNLFRRLRRVRVAPVWYAVACLLAPGLVLLVLGALSLAVSPVFAPSLFPLGFLFGPIAGFCEEIGWTGFAYPRLRQRRGVLASGVLLGLIWGVWHLPIVDFLGAASPHGAYVPAFFLAFVTLVTPMRVLIGLVSERTGSIALAQLMHASLTGSLALLSPPNVTPAQEALWYAVYGLVACALVAALAWLRLHGEQGSQGLQHTLADRRIEGYQVQRQPRGAGGRCLAHSGASQSVSGHSHSVSSNRVGT